MRTARFCGSGGISGPMSLLGWVYLTHHPWIPYPTNRHPWKGDGTGDQEETWDQR